MCFNSKQTKAALEVENRFKAKIDKLSRFKTSDNINDFSFPNSSVIIIKL